VAPVRSEAGPMPLEAAVRVIGALAGTSL